MNGKACVIGAGPNGLAAAIVLAQAGLHVDVLEAEATPGGAVRSMELTLPGYLHDFGSAVHPLGAGVSIFLISSPPRLRLGVDSLPGSTGSPACFGMSAVLSARTIAGRFRSEHRGRCLLDWQLIHLWAWMSR